MATYAEALAEARAALAAAGVESAGLDARLLLAAAAGIDQAALVARAREALPAVAERAFRHHVSRRAGGEPVARIFGQAEFWGLPLQLNDATLVPRPDTESLVEAVLQEVRGRHPQDITICDVGTGSGAIAIALLSELPKARAVATDISDSALAMARENAERHGVHDRIAFRQIDFAEGPEGPFDVVVSNPPYVASGVIAGLAREVREHDPRLALDGGPDGLSAYRAILRRAGTLLAPDGLLALEVGHDLSEAVSALCAAAGLMRVDRRRDLAGQWRVVTAHAKGSGAVRDDEKKALGKVGRFGLASARKPERSHRAGIPSRQQNQRSPKAGSPVSP